MKGMTGGTTAAISTIGKGACGYLIAAFLGDMEKIAVID